MYPIWIVVLNILIGLIGIILGGYLIANKLKLKSVLITEFILLSVGLLSQAWMLFDMMKEFD
jgi:C4-dicarboxylate transporter